MTIPEFEICFGDSLERILMNLRDGEGYWLVAKFNTKEMMPLQITDINRAQNTIVLTPMLNADQSKAHLKRMM